MLSAILLRAIESTEHSLPWGKLAIRIRRSAKECLTRESLVQALHLNANEREHLFFLAHQQPPPERAMEPETVSATLQHFLDHQGLSPAFVLGRRWDVVAWNEAARVVFGDFGQMTTRERNAVWRIFTSPTHRQLLVDWEGNARRLLAQFRASCGRYPGDPRLTELIHDLMLRSPDFGPGGPIMRCSVRQKDTKRSIIHKQAISCLSISRFRWLTRQISK